MSNDDVQFAAVLKQLEGAEHAALRQRSYLDGVVRQREEALRALKKEGEDLDQDIRNLAKGKRFDAIHGGQSDQVGTVAAYRARLELRLTQLKESIRIAEGEVESARVRLRLVDEEIAALRVDRKRIETLIEGRQQRRKIVREHTEELTTEEIRSGKRRPGEDGEK